MESCRYHEQTGRNLIGIGAYRRLGSANDFADPFSFGSSLSALLFGRDEGFYYRALGVELTGARNDSTSGTVRLFAEHDSDARKKTNFSLAKSFGAKGLPTTSTRRTETSSVSRWKSTAHTGSIRTACEPSPVSGPKRPREISTTRAGCSTSLCLMV
jgi:hypothetical protein